MTAIKTSTVCASLMLNLMAPNKSETDLHTLLLLLYLYTARLYTRDAFEHYLYKLLRYTIYKIHAYYNK